MAWSASVISKSMESGVIPADHPKAISLINWIKNNASYLDTL